MAKPNTGSRILMLAYDTFALDPDGIAPSEAEGVRALMGEFPDLPLEVKVWMVTRASLLDLMDSTSVEEGDT